MAATLDDIHKVLQEIKECTPCPPGAAGAAGAGTGGAAGAGAAAAAGAGTAGLAEGLGDMGAAAGSVNQLEDAVKQAQKAVGNAKKGTKEYDKALKELRKAQSELNKEVEKGTKEMGGFGKALGKTGKSMGNLAAKGFKALAGAAVDYIKKTMSLVSSLRATEQAMRATTGASAELADGIGRAYGELRIFGVTIGELSAVQNSLMSTTTDFTMMSRKQQDMLTHQAGVLQEVGVSTGDYATGIQVATKNMRMSAEGAAQWMLKLRATAIDLQMPISELTGKVGGMADELDLLGDKAIPVFGEMARLQKAAGVEMSKLLSMTNKFDTFKGAAEAAGGLNAALGGNFVNAMELHMAEDMPTRIKMLRDAMDAANKDWTTMGRQEKLFYAKALDSDVATVGKIMTSDLEALEKQMGKTEASIGEAEFDAFSMKSFEEIGQNMLLATMPSINAIENALTRTFDANARTMLAVTRELNQVMLKGTDDLLGSMPPWLMGLITNVMLLLTMFPQLGAVISTVLGGISAPVVATVALVVGIGAAVVGAIMAVDDAYDRVEKAGGNTADKVGATFLGIGKGILDGLDFIFGGFGVHLGWWEEGLIEKASRLTNSTGMSFKESWEELDFGYIGETFEYMWDSIIDGAYDFFVQPWIDLWGVIKLTAEESYQGMLEYFGIRSNSKKFEFMGESMVGGLIDPFDGLSKKMSTEMENAGSLTLEKAGETAGKLNALMGGNYISATGLMEGKNASERKAMIDQAMADAGKTSLAHQEAQFAGKAMGDDKPYVLNLSMNLDGREVDKKIVKVVGGVARDASWGT